MGEINGKPCLGYMKKSFYTRVINFYSTPLICMMPCHKHCDLTFSEQNVLGLSHLLCKSTGESEKVGVLLSNEADGPL